VGPVHKATLCPVDAAGGTAPPIKRITVGNTSKLSQKGIKTLLFQLNFIQFENYSIEKKR